MIPPPALLRSGRLPPIFGKVPWGRPERYWDGELGPNADVTRCISLFLIRHPRQIPREKRNGGMLGTALLLAAVQLLAAAAGGRAAAGDDEVVVHVLPHSHCDPGYKKTVESYYRTEVRHILDSVVDALQQRQDRRFVWAEGVFLERWWVDRPGDEEHQRRKEAFARLVQEGRIEVVNGGFVMHDDAITLYDSQIRQTTLGHVGILGRTVPTAESRVGYQVSRRRRISGCADDCCSKQAD